jgi:Flp pilus assembly protein TadD
VAGADPVAKSKPGKKPLPGLFDPCPCGSGQRYHSCCKRLGAAAFDPAALLSLATREHAANQPRAAEAFYLKALRFDGDKLGALRNYAILLTQQGRPAEAEPYLKRCLGLNPDDPHAHFALGVAQLQQQRLEEAAESFRAARRLDPANAAALANLGTVLMQLGRVAEGEQALERAAAEQPANPDPLLNLALLRSGRGEHDQALDLARRAVVASRGNAQAGFTYGVLALRAGEVSKAHDAFQAVVETMPDHAEAQANLGACLGDLGRPQQAVVHLERAVRLTPGNAKLWCNLALARLESGQRASAAEAIREAAKLAPGTPMVLGHEGMLDAASGRLDEAEARFREALSREADPFYSIGLGTVLYERGQPEAAAAEYQAFVQAHPDSVTMHFELGCMLLRLGRFREAWPHYAFRPQTRARRERGGSAPPLASLHGKRVALRFEQGLGDHLFFLRYLSAFRSLAQPAMVDYSSLAKVASLVARVPGIDHVTVDAPAQGIDVMLGDLPGYLGSETPPPPVRIASLPDARDRAAELLRGAGPGPYLAITWEAGQSSSPIRYVRAAATLLHKRIDPRQLGEALRGWPGTVLSLQRKPRAEDQAAFESGFGGKPADLGALNDDLETMLAVLEVADEYAGVSNTNMHLRAASGRPARVLVPRPFEWRWMYHGDESPWFPGFRLYRETPHAGWGETLEALRRDVLARA